MGTADKDESGTRAGKYKLRARVGSRDRGQSQSQEPSKGLGAGKYKYPFWETNSFQGFFNFEADIIKFP